MTSAIATLTRTSPTIDHDANSSSTHESVDVTRTCPAIRLSGMSTFAVHDHQHTSHDHRYKPVSPIRQGSIAAQLGIGLTTGVSLGVAARAFMRLLTEDPEFTWSGTLLIVGIFAVFGLVQSVVAAVRSRTTRQWVTVPTRLIGGLSLVLLGGGPGVLMLPFLWFGALALWQTTWRRWKRATLAALAAANMIGFVGMTLSEEGVDRLLETRALAGFALFAATYAATVWAVGPTLTPRSTAESVPTETIGLETSDLSETRR